MTMIIIIRCLVVMLDMLDTKKLMQKATAELVKVFGKKYLQDNYPNTCKAYGMVDDQTYQLFIGIKGSKDLPGRNANEKGWVVYGLVLLDAITGDVKKLDYALE